MLLFNTSLLSGEVTNIIDSLWFDTNGNLMSLLKTVQPYLNNYICILKLENVSLKYDLANAVDKTTP
jgi:hypothetical protein